MFTESAFLRQSCPMFSFYLFLESYFLMELNPSAGRQVTPLEMLGHAGG